MTAPLIFADLMNQPKLICQRGQAARTAVEDLTGASDKILNGIQEILGREGGEGADFQRAQGVGM